MFGRQGLRRSCSAGDPPTGCATPLPPLQVAIPKEKRPVTKHWNWVGLAIFLFYFGSLIYYIYIRATKTLNMGYLG